MATIENLHKDIMYLKKNLLLIKHMLEEDYELSKKAKKELAEARRTPESEYINLE